MNISKTPEVQADNFVRQLIIWLGETSQTTFHLVLSGGKTPSHLFSILAGKYKDKIPWQKIHFWWGDERMVPASDPESNFGNAYRLLFSRIELSENQIHRINGEADPKKEVERYGSEVRSLVPAFEGWPSFDLIMLGLGEDGHTASIFPDQLKLLNSDQITGIALHPTTGRQRITLTGKVLNNAKRVAFLITGESKSRIYNEIIHNTDNSIVYPASHINPLGELHWFINI
jgi:6-phosphogluconolactonase